MINNHREDIIRIDDYNQDSALEIIQIELKSYCAKKVKRCKVISLNNLNLTHLQSLYERSKIIVGHCLQNSNSTIIRAAVSGLLVLINECENGRDTRDFPIPLDHMYSDSINILDVTTRLLINFEEEQAKLEGFRSMYENYVPESIVRDTKRFMFGVTLI